jgi:hypothetical protein
MGINEVKILIEDLDDDARYCGIEREIVRQSILTQLRNTTIDLSEESSAPALYVNISTLSYPSSRLCVATVSLSLRATVVPALSIHREMSPKFIFGARIWFRGGILSGSRADFQKMIYDQVALLTDQFINDWTYDNR